MRRSRRRKKYVWTTIHGSEGMEWVITRKYLSSREVMLNYVARCLIEDGRRTRMSGLHTMISSGPLKYRISTSWHSSTVKE